MLAPKMHKCSEDALRLHRKVKDIGTYFNSRLVQRDDAIYEDASHFAFCHTFLLPISQSKCREAWDVIITLTIRKILVLGLLYLMSSAIMLVIQGRTD